MNLQTTINLDLKAIWHWWMSELAFLLPARLKQMLSDFDGRLLFKIESDVLYCGFQPNQQLALSEQLVINEHSEFQRLLQTHPEWHKAENILLLDQNDALQRIIELPLAALENLQQVVGFELDRYTPFRADQVYYSARLLSKTAEFIQVSLVFTPRARLEPYLQRLQMAGVTLHRVMLASAQTESSASQATYNLLPDQYRSRASTWLRGMRIGLPVVMSLLILLILALPTMQEQETVNWLKQEYKALDKPTQAVEAQQQAIDKIKAQTQAVIDFKQKSPKVLVLLTELTHLLDDATWLSHLQYAEHHLQIQGQSRAASALIARLEASVYFQNVNFVSPLTQDKTTGLERFQISMDVLQPEVVTPEPEQTLPVSNVDSGAQ